MRQLSPVGNAFAVLLVLAIAMFGCPTSTSSAELDAMTLVAKPELWDPLYAGSVLVVKALVGGKHLGLILNRPSRFTLAQLLPGQPLSRGIHARVYWGGPNDIDMVFALVASHLSLGEGLMQLAPYLHFAISAQAVNNVIATASTHAHFFAGAVLWQPGELEEELNLGAWYVLGLEPDYVFTNEPSRPWSQLVRRAKRAKRTVTAQWGTSSYSVSDSAN